MALTHSPRIARDGLVLHLDAANVKSYPGSGSTWKDLSGYGNDGTLVADTSFSSDNKGTMNFDGTGDYVAVSASSSINMVADQPVTISYWMYLNQTAAERSTFIGPVNKNYFGRSYGHLISPSTGGFLLYTDDDNSIEASSSTVISKNKWYHVCSVYTTTKISLYLDGELDTESSGTFSLTVDTNTLFIGSGSSSGYYLNGKMPIVQLYNRELSAAEILQNFNATRDRYGI